jgi:hypothetical protein
VEGVKEGIAGVTLDPGLVAAAWQEDEAEVTHGGGERFLDAGDVMGIIVAVNGNDGAVDGASGC